MADYLLDTNTAIYLEDGSSPFQQTVIAAFDRLRDQDEVWCSILTLYEIQFGLAASPQYKSMFERFSALLQTRFAVLPLPSAGAAIFGELKAAYLQKTGISKAALQRHNVDFLLASSAIATGATLVSSDKLFRTVQQVYPALQLADWTQPPPPPST